MSSTDLRATVASTPMSAVMIALNVIVFVAVSVEGRLVDVLALPPDWAGVVEQPWTMLTVAFIAEALIDMAVAVLVIGERGCQRLLGVRVAAFHSVGAQQRRHYLRDRADREARRLVGRASGGAERAELLDLHPIILAATPMSRRARRATRSMSGCVTRDLQPRRHREHVLDAGQTTCGGSQSTPRSPPRSRRFRLARDMRLE